MPVSPTELAVSGADSLEDQLAAFFGTHYERMTRLASLICHAGVPAEDAVQAAMEQAWRRRTSLREFKPLAMVARSHRGQGGHPHEPATVVDPIRRPADVRRGATAG